MTPDAFASIAALVKARSGIVLTADKHYLLEKRLAPLLRRDGLAGIEALALRLRGAGAEPLLREVVDALTTNESSFFRDGRPFEHLRRALPRLLARRGGAEPLRIWSAACSTGQEAYSVAMLLAESKALLGGRRVEILGTDLAVEVVRRAREGLYSQFEVQRGLPAPLLARWFRPEDARWRALPELRAAVRFETANLLGDTRRFGCFDVVFCRNVLIYFDLPTKTQVLRRITSQLAADGVLYLGGAETLLGLDTDLAPAAGERGVYELAKGGGSGALTG